MTVPPILPRDVDETAFTAALEALLLRVDDALCATFLDAEGETIDLATRIDPYDARVSSAVFAPVLARMRAAATASDLGAPRELRFVGEHRSAVVRHVTEGCDLLVVLRAADALPWAAWCSHDTARALAGETGLSGRRSISSPPEAPDGALPRAFLQDGRVRRVSAVLGHPDTSEPEALMVRTPEGDEVLIARDAATQRWYRR